MQITHLLRRIALVALLLSPGVAGAADLVYICYANNLTVTSDPLKVCTTAQREQLLSFTVAGNMTISSSGAAAGKAVFDAIAIQKRVSDLSAGLLTAYNKETQFQTILIAVEGANGAAAPAPVLTILLKNVYVHDWSWASDDTYLFTETYTLDFRTIEIYDAATKTTVTWNVPPGGVSA